MFSYKPSEKRELGVRIDDNYWPKITREWIIWFHFKGVMKNTAHHTKEPMKLINSLLKVLYVCNKDLVW